MIRVQAGFLAAAAYNIGGILVFSKGLTNVTMFEADPVMFSPMGCVLVMLWGLAYAAQSLYWRHAPALSVVFALEKLVYFSWWVAWIAAHGSRLGAIARQDALAGAFFAAYGAGDAAFGVFFAWAAWKARSLAS